MATAKKKAPVKKAPAKKAAPAKGKWTAVKPAKAESTEEKKVRPSPAMDNLDAYGITQVCAELVEGKSLTEVAKLAKVSIGSLLTWLEARPERSARAREARIQSAKLWDEQALQGIHQAKDKFALEKAKEAAHHLRWRAAKIAPRDYGDKLGLGAAADLPPLPTPPAPSATATVTFELPPGEAYAQMLQRKG